MSKAQIDILADYIMADIEGEPSKNEGAGDTAVRIMKKIIAENGKLKDRYDRLVSFNTRTVQKALRLEKAVALLNSMVLSGEEHSEQSRTVVEQALK